MPSARIVYNRTNGLTMNNGTLVLPVDSSDISVITATATATATVAPDANNASGNNTTAIAAGIAVPLSVLLIASLAFNWFLARKLRSSSQRVTGLPEHHTYHHVDTTPTSAADSQYKHEAYSRQVRTNNEVSAEREVVEIGSP